MNRRHVVTGVLALVVAAASLAPASGGGTAGALLGGGADKLLHAVGYAALAFAAAAAANASTARRVAGVVLAVLVFGVGVELLQPFVGRTASILDALADLAGATAGALAWTTTRSR